MFSLKDLILWRRKKKEEWFRRSSWRPRDKKDFLERLDRAHSSSRAQYLRIQALHLAEAGFHKDALELLDTMIGLYPDRSQLANAYIQRSESLQKLLRSEEALSAIKNAVVAEEACPNVQVDSALKYSKLVIDLKRVSLFEDALDSLQAYEETAVGRLPIQNFRLFAFRAIILLDCGTLAEASAFANLAVEAAKQGHSGFHSYERMGLVSEADPFLESVKKIAEFPPDQRILQRVLESKLPADPEGRSVVLELRKTGHDITSLWDWVNRPVPDDVEEKTLQRYLEQAVSASVTEALARILTQRRFKASTPLLIQKFRKAEDKSARWAIGNAISSKRYLKNCWPDLLELATNPAFGSARAPIVERLHRIKLPEVEPILIQLLDDPDVDINAVYALRYCGSSVATGHLRSLNLDEYPKSTRMAIAKALAMIERKQQQLIGEGKAS